MSVPAGFLKTSYMLVVLSLWSCSPETTPERTALPDEPSPPFRNIDTPTAYVGDEACASCHAVQASVYAPHAMARSFHAWTPETQTETPLDEPLVHGPSGLSYTVVDIDGMLYQEEFIIGPDGRRLHELRRRMDYVMGSGAVARTYFTEENGRLFQLPLTWYDEAGWDWSPGYEINNARFSRLMPNGCIACHGSYPDPIPFLEGKYAALRPGIGCERCHGPGALHVQERQSGATTDSTYDPTIVNPTHLPVGRRLDVCGQCHVHTPVTVLREGRDAFSYRPSEPLRDHAAFFKTAGSIDLVSHADRLQQSACFVATRSTEQPLECATCHNPHRPPPTTELQNAPCLTCHAPSSLSQQLVSSSSLSDHTAAANCVSCHMPKAKERTVPHGSFTDHWIRVFSPSAEQPRGREAGSGPVEPYFDRDRTGSDGEIYRAMGEIVYATLAPDARLLSDGAAALDRALRRDTTRADAHFFLGLAYQQIGNADDAIPALERSLGIDPDRPEGLHALAQAYEATGGDPARIDSLYRRALVLQPKLAWVRADFADFLAATGRREEAETAYSAALAEQPNLDVARFNLGTLLAGQGRLNEATATFQEAVRLNPLLAEALASLFQLRVAGNAVTGVRTLGSPLGSLPVRGRGPNAVQMTIDPRRRAAELAFVNVPPDGVVRILKPSGTLVRALPFRGGLTLRWDLLTELGNPVPGGLYRVQAVGPESGERAPSQQFYIGIIR